MSVSEAKVEIGRDVYLAPTSYVGGRVAIGDGSTVMHHVAIRGDVGAITIGRRVNVQDGSVIHTETGRDLIIEDEVSIGHRAVVHCEFVGARALIGIGAIVLDGCRIGAGCIVAAGALVAPRTEVGDGMMLMGVPARVIRETTETERRYLESIVGNYRDLGRRHAIGDFPNVAGSPDRE